MRLHLCIKVEPIPGGHIKDCVEQAKRLARQLDLMVEFDFNGAMMIVGPDHDVDALVEWYHRELENGSSGR